MSMRLPPVATAQLKKIHPTLLFNLSYETLLLFRMV